MTDFDLKFDSETGQLYAEDPETGDRQPVPFDEIDVNNAGVGSLNAEVLNRDVWVDPGDSVTDINGYLEGGDVHLHFPEMDNPIEIDERLVVYPNTKIRGHGDSWHISLADDSNDYVISNNERDENEPYDENITIEGLHIDGNKENQNFAESPSDEEGNRGALDFRNTKNLTVRDCLIFNPDKSGINYTFSEDTKILNNHIDRIADDGIAPNIETKRSVVAYNYISRVGEGTTSGSPHGIEVQDETEYTIVLGNTITDFGAGGDDGINVRGHDGRDGDRLVIIANNQVDGAPRHGIRVEGGDTRAELISVSGNTTDNNGARGINVTNGERVAVASNVVSNNVSGIILSTDVSKCTVTGNISDSNTNQGIEVRGDLCVTTSNIVVGNGESGILANSDYGVVAANLCQDNTRRGIRATIDVTALILAQNSIVGNDDNGIEVSDGDLIGATGNIIAENDGNGLVVDSAVNYTFASNNIIFDNSGIGIVFDGSTGRFSSNASLNLDTTGQTNGIFIRDDVDDIRLSENYYEANTGDDVRLESEFGGVFVRNGTAEDSGATDDPSTGDYEPGDIVDWTDTDDGSGTGVKLLLTDETWVQIAQ